MATLLFVLLILAILAVVAALPQSRAALNRARARLGDRFKQPQAYTGQTVITHTGDEYPIAERRPSRRSAWSSRALALARSEQLLAALVVILIGVIAFWQLARLTPSTQSGRFVVLVAPFSEAGGQASQTGRSVAAELVAALPQASDGRVVARLIDQPPADTRAALDAMARADADALIWGEITPGGMLNQESLRPLLAYRPTGPFAPAGWEGYAGRFEMPSSYALANAPLNGQVLLPPLLGALADYGAGKVDPAFTTLGALADNYPALAPALPRAIRGNILWARGEYDLAAGEYRRALGAATSDAPTQLALLFNNLGAILQDAGDPAARDAFGQAIVLLNTHRQDLGALRYNLGLDALRAGQSTEAAASLEQARRLLPPATPLLLALAAAYRGDGRIEAAQDALDAATTQLPADTQTTTPELRDLTGQRLRAAIQEQRALLQLAGLLQASGPLLWELQSHAPLAEKPLDAIRTDLAQSARETEQLVRGWSQRSAAEDAAGHAVAGRIALEQSRRATARLRERQRWLATVEIEIARAQGIRRPSGIRAIWISLVGDRTSLGQARARLEQLLASQPTDVEAAVLRGRALLLAGDSEAAAAQFDEAARMAPQRPEPLYGQALVVLPTDRARARQLLAQAIALDGRYLPARSQLAELAQEDGDWPVAIEQRRWLAQHRPSTTNTLALAQALRQSGPAGYAEAERALLPLANANNIPALIELSRIYLAHADRSAAREALDRAQRAAPRDPDVAYELGQLLMAQEDVDGARQQYQRAVEANPSHVQAHLALAQLAGADTEAAAREYRAALEAGASDPVALKQIGAVLLAHGEHEAARTAYERALAVSPDDPELHHGLGQATLGLNQLDTAQAAEQQALDLRQGNYAEALVGLGDIALRRGANAEAVQRYNAALQQNDQLTAAYLGLGRASAAEGNWSVAQAHFQNAVAHSPTSPEAQLWLGEALVRQNSPTEAIAAYTRAIELRPDYPEAHFGLAQAQMSTGKSAEALANLDQALKLRPRYPEALLLRGKLYEQQGRDQQAIEAYGQAIDASRQLAEPRYRRALLLIRHNQLDDASDDLEAAVAIQPNFPEAHYWLGRAYLVQSRPRDALEQFRRAVEQRGGNYPEARFYQGLAEEQLGQRAEAAESFRTALEQDRSGPWATQAQAALTRIGNP